MSQSKKRVAVACIGTILEWFEFSYYGFIAIKISKIFFPPMSGNYNILAAFAIFAISYFVRPIGAIFFGYIGDQHGRRVAMQSAIILMALSSGLMGLLPTYHSVGLWAPCLLLLCRLVQGLAVSGEFNGSSVYLMEHASKNLCFSTCWTMSASYLGFLLGCLSSMITSWPGTPAWAWRIPFLIGALACIGGIFLRQGFEETPKYLDLRSRKVIAHSPIKTLFKKHLKPLTLATILSSGRGIITYVTTIFYVHFLSRSEHIALYQTKQIVTFGLIVSSFMSIYMARVADRVGPTKVIGMGMICIFFAGPTIFLIAMTHSLALIAISQLLFSCFDVMITAPIFLFINQLFPTNVRYTGASFSWSIGMAVFGGTAPFIATCLQDWTHLMYAPGFYVSLGAATGIITLVYATKHDLQRTEDSNSVTPTVQQI